MGPPTGRRQSKQPNLTIREGAVYLIPLKGLGCWAGDG